MRGRGPLRARNPPRSDPTIVPGFRPPRADKTRHQTAIRVLAALRRRPDQASSPGLLPTFEPTTRPRTVRVWPSGVPRRWVVRCPRERRQVTRAALRRPSRASRCVAVLSVPTNASPTHVTTKHTELPQACALRDAVNFCLGGCVPTWAHDKPDTTAVIKTVEPLRGSRSARRSHTLLPH